MVALAQRDARDRDGIIVLALSAISRRGPKPPALIRASILCAAQTRRAGLRALAQGGHLDTRGGRRTGQGAAHRIDATGLGITLTGTRGWIRGRRRPLAIPRTSLV